MKPYILAGVVLTATMSVALLADGQRVQPIRPQSVFGVGTPPQTAPGSDDASPFFDDSVLQEIRLTINTKDWQTLKTNYLLNDYYPCTLTWRGQTVNNVGIRSRGTGSRSGVKPGLRIDFDRYTTNQKFLGLKSFVLRNNTQDQSSLHERLSMLLFRRAGEVGSRETHTKFFVNDQYEGLFTIVESLDKTFLKKNLGEDSGYLYKYDYPADGTPYYFADKGSDPNLYVPLPFKPETNETAPQPEYVAQWVQAVNQASDAAFLTTLADYLDVSKFLTHIAVEIFVADYDGFVGNYGINNFYVYRFNNTKRFQLLPWDKSEAFKAGADAPIFHNLDNSVPTAQRNRLIYRLLSFPAVYSQFLDTLQKVSSLASEPGAGDPRGWLEREVQFEYTQIRDAALADPTKPYSNAEFEASIQALLDYARNRSSQVNAQIAAARR